MNLTLRPAFRAQTLPGLIAACLMATVPAAWAQSPESNLVREHLRQGRPHQPAELLVQFRPQAGTVEQQRNLRRVQGTVIETVMRKGQRPDAKGDLLSIRVPPGRALADVITQLEADESVEFAEPNWTYTRQQVIGNDPYASSSCLAPDAYNGNRSSNCLWGVLGEFTAPANPYGSGALQALSSGLLCDSNVHVGVIDEGIMVTHTDLAANIWVNPLDSTINKVDNDANGFIDDTNGWDFAGRNRTVYDGASDDHGTHVAGTIASSLNNGAGGFGVCPSAKLISAKFLGTNSGTTANAIAAVNYLTMLKKKQGLKIVATNNSWGGGGFSSALRDAINTSGAAGILFVVAAGNSNVNIDVTPSYPASYRLLNMISVAAINSAGARASFSNYGATTVDIAAPGTNILSTVPTSSGRAAYAYYAGTSMATPHVTGAAALFASKCPNATGAQIKTAILAAARVNTNLNGLVVGSRQLDVSNFATLTCPTTP